MPIGKTVPALDEDTLTEIAQQVSADYSADLTSISSRMKELEDIMAMAMIILVTLSPRTPAMAIARIKAGKASSTSTMRITTSSSQPP